MLAKIIFSILFVILVVQTFPTTENCELEVLRIFSKCMKNTDIITQTNTTEIWESTKEIYKCIEKGSENCKEVDQKVSLALILSAYFSYIEKSKIFGHCIRYNQYNHPCSEHLDENIDLIGKLFGKCKFVGDSMKNCTIGIMEYEKCGDFEIGEFVKIHHDMVETVGC